MASNIVPDTIDDAYPVAGQDNDSQGFRDNFNIIKTNFTYAKQEIETLQDDTAKTNADNNFFENENFRYISKQESIKASSTNASDEDKEINLTNGHHHLVTIANADRTLTFTGWTAHTDDGIQPDGEYQEMIVHIQGDGTPRTVTFASKNAAGTDTADYWVQNTSRQDISGASTDASGLRIDWFAGAAQIITTDVTNRVHKIKAYTMDNGNSLYLEYIGTFNKIT